MGLLGILLALALLIFLAYRGWSVLLLAPAAALVAAAVAREPLLANWTQTFIQSRNYDPNTVNATYPAIDTPSIAWSRVPPARRPVICHA